MGPKHNSTTPFRNFVTGAALYPQNPGMNPTGPLLALAYFAGEALSQRYFRTPRELLV